MISDFHNWTLEWTPNELVYKFDGEVTFRQNLNRVIDGYYAPNWATPFDQYFYVVLNTAVGGDFIDGPDESDVWTYPEAEFIIDSITITPLEQIIDSDATECATDSRCENCRPDTAECSGENAYLQYTLKESTDDNIECIANEAKTTAQLCGSMKYFCHDPNAQNEVNLGQQEVCNDGWGTIGCCYADDGGASCDRDAVIADATDIYAYRYDVIDRCGNWKWDQGLQDMVFSGDFTASCDLESTSTYIKF